MIIISQIFLLLIFFNYSNCWVIGPALASTEYSKRLQFAQQKLNNENKINKTSSFELNDNFEVNEVKETTMDFSTTKSFFVEEEEHKGPKESMENENNEVKKLEQVMPSSKVSNKAEFVQKAMSAFMGKMEGENISIGEVQPRHDEFKKMAEYVLKNNLSESDVIDPWKDDIKSLGLTVNSSDISNENEEEEEEDENSTKTKLNKLNINTNLSNKSKNVELNNQINFIHIRVHVKPEENFAERRARHCSNNLAPFMPKLRNHSTPFIAFNLTCILKDQGNTNNNFCFPSKNAYLYKPSLTEQLWNNSDYCLDGIWKIVNSSSECVLVIGFVDSILDISKTSGSLISRIEEAKELEKGKSKPVVRLFCNNNAIAFYKEMTEFEKGPPGYLDADGNVRTNEELFLKTVFVLEYTWHKGCIVVFFDSRTINSQHKLGKFLLQIKEGSGGHITKFGIRDGSNRWAASKAK